MKDNDKIDLILKELYERHPGMLCSLKYVIACAKIDIKSLRKMKVIAKKLNKDDLIEVINIEDDLLFKITSEGKSFCERSSYAFPGFPLITHRNAKPLRQSRPNSLLYFHASLKKLER